MPIQALVDAFHSLAEKQVERTNYTELRWELRARAYKLLQEARTEPEKWTPVEFLEMKHKVPQWVVDNINNYRKFMVDGLALVYVSIHDSNETMFREKAIKFLAVKKQFYEKAFAKNREGIIAINGTDSSAHAERVWAKKCNLIPFLNRATVEGP